MSREIDERVVQMQFDNAQFESGAQTTMGTLDKLKAKLGFEGATKGIEEIQNASKSFNLSPISNAVETVQMQFGAMEIFVFNALSRISNYAISTGINLVKSLSINQIAAGWSKYEMKTNSVQTIMNAGYDLDKVNESLEKLNWFTDETSYSYTDMVNNISKFTSSNVALDTAITSMIGIADAAGLAGASVQDASHAMEGFSKAIAQGYMSRQNWQWIRTAHMDTTMFKQTLIDAAVEEGTLKKLSDGRYKVTKATGKSTKDLTVSIEDFETAMHHGWVTTNVMNNALGKFGGATEKIYAEYERTGKLTSEIIKEQAGNLDELGLKAFKSAQVAKTFTDAIQSVKDAVSTGWMTTFEIIFGDFNEATELWTDLANEMWDVFAAGGAERNEMLKQWKELGGRDSFINAFWNTWNGVLNIINTVKDSFRDIFPPLEAKKLLEYTKQFEAFTDKFRRFFEKDALGDDPRYKKGLIPEEITQGIDAATERVENLSRAFKGVFAIFDIIKQTAGAIAQLAGVFIKALIPSFDSVLGTAGNIGEWLVNLNQHLKDSGFFGKIVEKATPVIETFGKVVKKVIDWITAGLSFIVELLGKLRDHFKPVADNVSSFTEWISPKFAALGKVLDFFKGILNGIKIIYDDIKPLLGRVWTSFTDALGAFWGALREGVGNLTAKDGIDIFSATELSLAFKHLIDLFLQFKNSNIFSQVMRYFRDGLWDIEDVWERVRWNLRDLELDMKAWAADKTAGAILKVAGAIAIMAGSLILLSGIDPNKLAVALLAISALSGIVVGLGRALAWVVGSGAVKIKSFKDLIGGLAGQFSKAYQWQMMSKSLLYVAGAIAILAAIAAIIGQVDPAKLTTGIIAVGFLCLELSFMAAVLSTVGKEGGGRGIITTAFGLIEFVIALGILVAEVKALASMSPEQLVQGLLAVMALIFMLTAAAKVLERENTAFATKKGFGAGTGFALIELAASLVLIVQAIKRLGALDTDTLSKGMSGVTLLLVELVAASYILGKIPATRMLASAVGLIAMSGALHILVSAVKKMGGLTDDEMGRGLGGLAAGLIELCVAALFLQDAIPAAGALLMMGGALFLIAAAMQTLASLGYENLIGLIFALAGIFTVIGVAATILTPISAGLMTFAGALALVGLAVALVGVGISGIAIGLLILLKVLESGVSTILNGLRELIVGVLLILRDCIPLIVQVVVEALVAIVVAIGDNADLILMAVVNVIVALVHAVWTLLVALWNTVLAPLFPQMIGFLTKVGDAIYDYVIKPFIYMLEVVIGFIASLIWGALELMFGWLGFFFPEVTEMFENGWSAINNLFTYEDSKKVGEEVKEGFIDGLGDEGENVEKVKAHYRAMKEGAQKEHEESLPDWKNMSLEDFEAYIKGGEEMKGPLYDSGYDLTAEIYNGANAYDLYGDLYGKGQYGAQGFIAGVKSKMGELWTTGNGLGGALSAAVAGNLKEASPSKVMLAIGAYATQGLINGVVSLKDRLINESADVADSSVNSMRAGFSRLSDLINDEVDADPTIRPVLDLSEIQNGVGTMNGMFNDQTISMSGRIGSIHSSSDPMSDRMEKSLSKQFKSFEDRLQSIESDRSYQFSTTVELDGRQIARSTAVYTNEELDRITRRNNRKAGIV